MWEFKAHLQMWVKQFVSELSLHVFIKMEVVNANWKDENDD